MGKFATSSKIANILFILFTVSSCVFRPNYEPPYVDVPEEWRVETSEECTFANLRWWEQFQDPVLNELIAIALENNNDLKVAIARVDEFFGLWGMTRSQLFPQFNGTFSAFRQQASLETVPPVPPDLRFTNDYAALFNASYEIDLWGRIQSATDAALADLLGQVEARRVVVQTLVSSVAASYVMLRQFDKQFIISQQTYRSRQESERIARVRFKEGLASEMEIRQAESESLIALIRIKELEIAIEQQENALSVLLGQNPEAIPRGLTITEWFMPPQVPSGLPSELLEQRPDILQAEQTLVAAQMRVGEAKAAFFPEITLTGFAGGQSEQLRKLFSKGAEAWQYGASVFQPLFTGGFLLSQLDVARARQSEALFNYLSVIQNAFKEVDDALIAHQKTLELVSVQRQREEVLQSYLRLARLQHQNGQVDYLNVLDAERNLFATQLELAQTQADSFITLINLYKALGGGWIFDADNQAMYPVKHRCE